ncbi:hypothetical protein DWF04_003050 [Cereibacter sphaeroides f. sp. denitrificans]|nr:hypothetical protein DWF04_09100 [Cereibacter sphaeroides f. sp. denitrificans]
MSSETLSLSLTLVVAVTLVATAFAMARREKRLVPARVPQRGR